MKKNSINAMAFFNILGPVFLNGINFFTIPIFTRILGTENYGLYTIYCTWLNVLVILISVQVQGTIGVANIRYDEKERKSYYSSICSIILLSFTCFLFIAFIFLKDLSIWFGLPKIVVIIMLFNALGMALVNFSTTKFTYNKEAQKTFIVSVSVAVSGIVLSLIILRGIEDNSSLYLGRIMGAAIPYICIGLGLGIVIFFKGRTGFSYEYWKFCLPLCIPLIFHGLSHIILGQADKVMLQKMTTDSVVGIFGFTVTFAQIINIIYNALNTTWVPFYYEDMSKGHYAIIKKRTNNYIFVYTSLSLGFILLAPEVIKLFAEKVFWSGTSVIPILVLGYYMMFLYSFPVNFEFYHKKTIHIAIGTGAAAIINCILNYFMIKYRGMQGAAEATFIAYGLLWIFHHLVAKYIVKEKYHYKIKEFLPGFSIMIFGCILVQLTQNLLLVRWIIAGIIGLILLRHIVKEKSIF